MPASTTKPRMALLTRLRVGPEAPMSICALRGIPEIPSSRPP